MMILMTRVMPILAGLPAKKLLLALIVFFNAVAVALPVASQDLGVVAKVYPIAEEDLLTVMQQRAAEAVESGAWDEIVSQGKTQAQNYAKRPAGVALPLVTEAAKRKFDPTLIIPYPIADAEGRVLQPAGTSINPLRVKAFNRKLAFFNADDPLQREWADRFLANNLLVVPILVQGPVLEVSQAWGRQVFFDQTGKEGGSLVRHFGIQKVPSLVYQDNPEDFYLVIEEVAVQELMQ